MMHKNALQMLNEVGETEVIGIGLIYFASCVENAKP